MWRLTAITCAAGSGGSQEGLPVWTAHLREVVNEEVSGCSTFYAHCIIKVLDEIRHVRMGSIIFMYPYRVLAIFLPSVVP